MFLLALSIGLNLSFLDLGWIRSFIVIITMLPISFSGIGVREASLIVLLQPYSVSSSDAVALSFLLLGKIILFGTIGALLEARDIYLVNNSKSKAKEIVT